MLISRLFFGQPAASCPVLDTVSAACTQADATYRRGAAIRPVRGEAIATGFVESTVNAVVSKRMVKKQQMQWTPKGSHLLLQVRTKVLNGELDDLFREWYPSFRTPPVETRAAAA